MASLKGSKINIYISDPWDFGELYGCGPFFGTIIEVDQTDNPENVLVKFDKVLEYKNEKCEYFVVSVRHEGEKMTNILSGKKVICSMSLISKEQAKSPTPFNLSQWRGGVGLIGDISLIEKHN